MHFIVYIRYVHISFVIKVIKKKLQDQVIFFLVTVPLHSKLIKSEIFWLITNFSNSLLYTIIAIVLKPTSNNLKISDIFFFASDLFKK